MTESCETCRFVLIDEGTPFCRRYPPRLVNEGSDMGQGGLVSAFPQTDLLGCGEYKPLPDEAMRKANDAGQSKP